MYTLFLRSIVAITAALHLSASAAEYSLDQLIDTALATSTSLESVNREIKKADAQISEAWGSAFPKVTASINQNYDFAQYIPYATSGGGSATDTSEVGRMLSSIMSGLSNAFETPKNTSAFSLSVNQPIFAQGKVGVGLRIARAYKNTLAIKYEAERHKVINSVTGAYLGAIMARNNVAIQKESVTLAGETHRLTLLRHALGKGTELDTLTSRLHLENARIDLEKAESDRLMAYESIAVICNLPEKAVSLVITGELPIPDFLMTENEVSSTLRSSNEILRQLESGEKIQNELVSLSRTDFYPLIYASGSFSRIGMYDFDNMNNALWGNDCSVAIGLSWELFSGSTRKQRLLQKQEDRQMYLLTKKQTAHDLELAASNVHKKVMISKKRYAAMENVVTLAQKGYHIARKAFEVGSGTQLDMQNAELEYNKARLACNAVLLDYNLALIELRQLIGNQP